MMFISMLLVQQITIKHSHQPCPNNVYFIFLSNKLQRNSHVYMEHKLKPSFVGGRKRNSYSPTLDYLLSFT